MHLVKFMYSFIVGVKGVLKSGFVAGSRKRL